MISILKEEIKAGPKGHNPYAFSVGQGKGQRHDVVLCANVPALLTGSIPFLKDADDCAKKAVFLIESAGPNSDKFYYKELYPLIFKKPFSERTDYLTTYIDLHSIGILANVEIIEYDFDQPFDNLDEALLFWKEYMGIVTEEHDRTLRDYLSKKLVKRRNALLAKFHKKAAIIWWRKGGGSNSAEFACGFAPSLSTALQS